MSPDPLRLGVHPSGWCMSGRHGPGPDTEGCPAIFPTRTYPAETRKGATYTIAGWRCPCECHARDLD